MASRSDFIYPNNGVPHSETKVASAPHPDVQNSRVKIKDAVITSTRKFTHDTFLLKVKLDNNEYLESHAGQYGTLKADDLDKPRAFSFARGPNSEKKGEFSFFIKQIPGGLFSEYLNEDRTGQKIVLSGPMGQFKIDESNEDMVCIAGGSGMSAINAIVEEAAHSQVKETAISFMELDNRKIYTLLMKFQLLKKWAKGFTFKFIPVLSEEPEDSDWEGGRGFVTDFFKENFLKTGIVKAESCKAFFCGPPPMIDAGAKVLKEAGVSEESMFFDKFEDARSPAPVIDNSKCVLCDECLLVKPTADCIVETAKLGDVKENGKFADIKRIDPAFTSGLYYNTLYINEDKCIRCYACVHACPHKAISPNYDLEPKTLRNIVEN